MLKKIVLFALFFSILGINSGFTQISINDSDGIETMIMQRVERNKLRQKRSGWRIQLVASTDRTKMENILAKWRGLYPEIEPKWFHSKPYYIVRIGAFSNKLETLRFIYKINDEFRGCYPAKDDAIPNEDFFNNYL